MSPWSVRNGLLLVLGRFTAGGEGGGRLMGEGNTRYAIHGVDKDHIHAVPRLKR